MKTNSETLVDVYRLIIIFGIITLCILVSSGAVMLAKEVCKEVKEIEKKGIKNIILPIWEGKED